MREDCGVRQQHLERKCQASLLSNGAVVLQEVEEEPEDSQELKPTSRGRQIPVRPRQKGFLGPEKSAFLP